MAAVHRLHGSLPVEIRRSTTMGAKSKMECHARAFCHLSVPMAVPSLPPGAPSAVFAGPVVRTFARLGQRAAEC